MSCQKRGFLPAQRTKGVVFPLCRRLIYNRVRSKKLGVPLPLRLNNQEQVMVAELRKIDKSLYETDYNLWVLEMVDKLQRRELESLDWENLIEEVTDLSRRDRNKLASLLTRLLEHLLKLGYWRAEKERNQNHWRREILNFRLQVKRLLKDSPSLKPYLLEIFNECYEDGRKLARESSGLLIDHFPEQPIANLDQILDETWFPPSSED
jgi:hypothetical protein